MKARCLSLPLIEHIVSYLYKPAMPNIVYIPTLVRFQADESVHPRLVQHQVALAAIPPFSMQPEDRGGVMNHLSGSGLGELVN